MAGKLAVRRAAGELGGRLKVGRPSIEDYVKAVAGLPAAVVRNALEIAERNMQLLAGRNPWVYAAAVLYVANKRRGVKTLAKAAGVTEASVREAAKMLKT